MTTIDRILFGDNQFFGVNHMSEEKARAQAMRFQSLDAVIDVLDSAYDAGVKTFMCTPHDRVAEICDQVHVLDFGRLIASGAPGEVLTHPAVVEAYLGVGAVG